MLKLTASVKCAYAGPPLMPWKAMPSRWNSPADADPSGIRARWPTEEFGKIEV